MESINNPVLEEQISEIEWLTLNRESFPIYGSSAHVVDDNCYVIGGWRLTSNQNYLSLSCFNITQGSWLPIRVNSKGFNSHFFKEVFLILVACTRNQK